MIPRVYLDANATYGGLPEAFHDPFVFPQEWLWNPNAQYQEGQRARAVIEDAREALRVLVNAPHSRSSIIFTSGATESNNAALCTPFLGTYQSETSLKGHIVSCLSEHPAVLEPIRWLERFGVSHTLVSPSSSGAITVDSVLEALRPETALVSFMLANNETGVINDIEAIARAVRSYREDIVIHCDAVQAIGKIPVDFLRLGVDLFSISGHKFGALSGVGALVVREGLEFAPMLRGGSQENKRRGGTENVAGIGSLGAVCSYLYKNFTSHQQSLQEGSQKLALRLVDAIPECEVNFASQPRLPNTLSLTLSGVFADDLVVALDLQGVSISAGSACSSGKPLGSPILRAYGFSESRARQTVRVSNRADLSEEQIDRVVEAFQSAVSRMRNSQREVA